MNEFAAALWMEWLKAKRSKILWITLLVFVFIGVTMGLLVFVAQHPEIAGNSGVISAKASVFGQADWPSFLLLLIQCVLALGVMGFGIVTSWVFGREYSDRVVKDLLALPVPRSSIIVAKFILCFGWNLALAGTLLVSSFITAALVGLPGWSSELVWHNVIIFMVGSVLTLLLCTPIAFIAVASRGYLLPIGFSIFILVITNLIAVGIPALMPYFPWAIPALASGITGPNAPHVDAVSYALFAATVIAGFFATMAWWNSADQT
ncbi:MAG: ABC transporter permease [Chitinivibrionales bacterium]|nr:ABC transporter permease [Chitinivibrionales bacterium]